MKDVGAEKIIQKEDMDINTCKFKIVKNNLYN